MMMMNSSVRARVTRRRTWQLNKNYTIKHNTLIVYKRQTIRFVLLQCYACMQRIDYHKVYRKVKRKVYRKVYVKINVKVVIFWVFSRDAIEACEES